MTDALGPDADEQRARAAHLYFMLGLTQAAVGERMGLSRMKVHRLLAEARERGIVRIHIAAPSAARLDLEARLAERFSLGFVAVTAAETASATELSEVIGRYAAQAIAPLLRDRQTVALGWGVTLKALATSMAPTALEGATVAPLLGSLSRSSSIDRFEAGAVLAQRLGAECFHLPAPIICDSARSRDVMLGQSIMREVLARAAAADLALFSVGGTRCSTLRAMGFVSEAEMAQLAEAGAIGNFLGYFHDAGGRILGHPINDRVVGLHPGAAREIPARIMVSGGADKAPILGVLLARGWATGLVTDEDTAALLLA